MAVIRKKTWPEHFKLVKKRKKNFELRLTDFRVKEGDLEEWNPKKREYTGRKLRRKVKYVLKFNLDDFGQKKEIKNKGLYVI
jgi:hypothetical protein